MERAVIAFAVSAVVALFAPSPPGSGATVERRVDDYGGSFSPDGKSIVFSRVFSTIRIGVDTHPVARRAAILVMRADGSGKRILRHDRARFEEDPSYSPDGRSIIFVRDGQITVMRRDGSHVRALTRGSREHACPRFSPDGSRVSYWRGTSTSGAYLVMNADGTGARRISLGHRFAWGCPSWFPDGEQVVYAKDYKLYVVAADGGTAQELTDDRDGTFYRPAVSPDGRSIAVHGWHRRSGDGIVVMRQDGSAIRRITTSLSETESDAAPSWSPDGKRILFSGYRTGTVGAGVYLVRRDGSGRRRLSNLQS